MKHFFMPIVLALISLPTFGQLFVGKVDIDKSDSIKVIEVMIAEKMSNKYVDVYIDFGQKSNFKAGSIDNNPDDQRITDSTTGKPVRFKSTADVLNFLEAHNWDHYDSVIIADRGERLFYYYLRKK
ncbi:hypothetical protein MUK70_10285 [Dyadobacter chenwenxiniae]|uniref:Uncharacterized protein n=1 Tax=Dyadobacter chenwenxiniae TaxID=2906456 RepID=A0A9X1PQU7_9BACT|nr:hypothetical protein [Dyadobacter chenwenxiniae]MCF0063246.1 hypothetical protein [Dyadobacter chenwenxiniae]UON85373.1 hypothetical protein MUK70_10285 [Dyadobacter chenwenxiniae]